MWIVHDKAQGDCKSFKLWGQRIKSPPKVVVAYSRECQVNEEVRNNSYYSRRKEWKSCATLVEGGTHSTKLRFGTYAKLDEGKGLREKY